MKQSNSKTMVRVITLLLAFVVLAGTVLGLLGSIMAYATPMSFVKDGPAKYEAMLTRPTFKLSGVESDKSTYEPAVSSTYTLRTSLRIDKDQWADSKQIPSLWLTGDSFRVIGDNTQFTGTGLINNNKKNSDEDTHWEYAYFLEGVIPRSVPNALLQATAKSPDGEDFKPLSWPNLKFEGNTATLPLSSNTNTNTNTNTDTDSDSKDKTTSDPEVLTTPKMIITSFNVPDEVKYGEEFDVTIEFLNNSQLKNMENVSMTLTPSEGVSIRNGVNKRHYVKVPHRQSTSETFTLKASSKLAAEALTLTVKFDYQYKLDNVYKDGSSEEVLYVTAIPKPEEKKEEPTTNEGSISSFEILSVVPPESMYANEDGYLTVKVINKDHLYDASNVQLSITGEGMANSGNTEYHGALAHSSQAEIETSLQFVKAGTYTLEAIVTYEDSSGKDATGKPIVRINDVKKEFTVTVQESPAGGMNGGMNGGMGMMPGGTMPGEGVVLDENGMPVIQPEASQGLTLPQIGMIAGGSILLLIIIIVVIRVIRKKKAEAEDETI